MEAKKIDDLRVREFVAAFFFTLMITPLIYQRCNCLANINSFLSCNLMKIYPSRKISCINSDTINQIDRDL